MHSPIAWRYYLEVKNKKMSFSKYTKDHSLWFSIIRTGLNFLLILLLVQTCSAPQSADSKPATDPQDIWGTLDQVVGEAPVVALGEPSHFLEAIHQFNKEMFMHLVENKGFRVFCFESFWELEFALEDFMQSDRTELTNLEQFYLNAFSSRQTRELLLAIREYNQQHPDDPLYIIGYQPEQPVSDTKAIFKFFEESSFEMPESLISLFDKTPAIKQKMENDLDAVVAASQKRRAGEPAFTKEEYESVMQAGRGFGQFLQENKENIIKETSEEKYTILQQRAISLHAYGRNWMKELNKAFDPNITPEETRRISQFSYQFGDSIRAEIFEKTMSTRFKGKKAMIWMHNWHAAKRAELTGGNPENGHPPLGTRSFGSQMLERIGEDYVVIASVVACPDCEYDRSLSIEDRFYQKFGQDTLMVDLKNIPSGLDSLQLDKEGTFWVQAGSSNFEKVKSTAQFDGLLYLPQSDLTIGKPK